MKLQTKPPTHKQLNLNSKRLVKLCYHWRAFDVCILFTQKKWRGLFEDTFPLLVIQPSLVYIFFIGRISSKLEEYFEVNIEIGYFSKTASVCSALKIQIRNGSQCLVYGSDNELIRTSHQQKKRNKKKRTIWLFYYLLLSFIARSYFGLSWRASFFFCSHEIGRFGVNQESALVLAKRRCHGHYTLASAAA